MQSKPHTMTSRVLHPTDVNRRTVPTYGKHGAGRARRELHRASPDWESANRTAVAPAVAAFVLGLATTMYVTVIDSEFVTLRPVQLVPSILLPLALMLPRKLAIARGLPLRGLALLWTAYMVGRLLFVTPNDPMAAVRALTCAMTFFAVMELSLSETRPNSILIGLLAGCLLSVIVAAVDLSLFGKSPRYQGSSRWAGLMPDPNRFANICGLALVICFAMFNRRMGVVRRYIWTLCLIVCAGGLLASGSRGGIAAAAVACLATVWFSANAHSRRLKMANYIRPMVWLGAVGITALFVFRDHVPDRVWEFIILSSEGRDDVESDPRRDIAAAVWDKFQSSPLLGGGTEYVLLDGEEIASHNSYLYVLSTAGLIGFFFYSALLGVIVHRLWSIVRRSSIPVQTKLSVASAFGGLIFLLVHMCVIDLGLSAHAWAFFGYAAAVAIRCSAMAQHPAMQVWRNQCG